MRPAAPPDHTDEGLRAAVAIRAEHPEIAIMVLSASIAEAYVAAHEREVLGLMAEGLTNGAIADRLVVSEAAVRKHVGSIFGKLPLGAESDRRVAAVLAYLRG